MVELQQIVANKFESNKTSNPSDLNDDLDKSIETVTNLNKHFADITIVEGERNVIPKIERYFVLNGKISLVDSENNLWHLTKCNKYKQAKKESNLEGEKFLNEFLEIYQRNSNNKQNVANTGCDQNENEKNILKKNNNSNFDSVNHYNMTTIGTNQNSEKNYDSLVLDNEVDIKFQNKIDHFNEGSSQSDLVLKLDNNESLILSDSE